MQRRSFLGIFAALIAGPSIAKLEAFDVPDFSNVVPVINDIKLTGFPDTKNLNQLRLVHSISKLCTEHKITPGTFVRTDKDFKEFEPLKGNFEVIPIGFKAIAIHYTDNKAYQYYDEASVEFKNVKRLANLSKGPGSPGWGYCYGTELQFKMGNDIIMYPCISKTARRFATELILKSQLGEDVGPIVIGSNSVKARHFSFYAPQIMEYNRKDWETQFYEDNDQE